MKLSHTANSCRSDLNRPPAVRSKIQTHSVSFVENAGLSAFAALASKTTAAPVERIKLILQSEEHLLSKGTLKNRFQSPRFINCLKWIYSTEGVLSYWRGNWISCVRYVPMQALNFAFCDQIKRFFSIGEKNDREVVKLAKTFAAGAAAGSASLLVVYPLDYVRTRLANDIKCTTGSPRQFSGFLDCCIQAYRTDGLTGPFRGYGISCFAVALYRGFYFGLFDYLRPILLRHQQTPSFGSDFLLGYGCTVSAGLIVYPLDTIRRRMMMTVGEPNWRYRNSWDCARQIFLKGSWRSFYSGCGANIFRSVAGAGVLAGFEHLKSFYIDIKKSVV